MGFRHSRIGINFTSKGYVYIYIYIQVEFHLIQNLNPIGIKISNQFVCCYLINPLKSGIKKRSYEQKEKRKLFFFNFFGKKRKLFFYNPKKKKNKCLLYIDTFLFLEKKEKVVYFKLKYLLPYLHFFLKILSKNIFGELV